jgi:hypothetical protein
LRDVVGDLRPGRPCGAQDIGHVRDGLRVLFAFTGRMVEQGGEIVAMDGPRGGEQLATDSPNHAADPPSPSAAGR